MQGKQAAGDQLAVWLLHTHPDLFLAAYHMAAFGATPKTTGLGDVSDFLSSLGDTVESAASSVGNWLTTGGGLNSLASIGTAYMNSQTQQNVLQTQIARAQAQQPPLAITYQPTATGQVVPVLPVSAAGTPVTVAGQNPQVVSYVQATPSVLATYTPAFNWQQYLPYIGVGLALLLGLSFIRR